MSDKINVAGVVKEKRGMTIMEPGSENYLTTAQAADLLNITPAAVRRLVREGLLEVKHTRRYKFGLDQSFDRAAVEKLLPRLPEFKRKWHAEEDLRLGAKKAAFKRLEDQKKTRAYQGFKERFLLSLEDYPERVALLLRTSFFLYHLNHYAKGGEEYLYDLKEETLKKMSEKFTSLEGLEVILVEGGEKIYLCETCRLKARSMGLDYVKYKSVQGGCPRCRKESDYYSLFEFRVKYGDHFFCFHTPYQVAKSWLKDPLELPCKTHVPGREEARAFGRPITEAEALAVSLEEVIRELEVFTGEPGG